MSPKMLVASRIESDVFDKTINTKAITNSAVFVSKKAIDS